MTIHFDDPGVGLTIVGTNGPDVIQGGPLEETINAGPGTDVVCGGGGNDTIDGGPAPDELFGQAGSDQFEGPDLGQDRITGGSREADKAKYVELPAAVQVNLASGLVSMAGAGVDGRIVGVEAVIGSHHDDTLVGRAGDESLRGGAGDDTIEGGAGTDDLTGDDGTDTLSHRTASVAVSVNLASEDSTDDDIDTFESVIGGPFADRLRGTEEGNHLVGGGGEDVLKGRDGDDILEGRGGDDTLFPGQGDDVVDGGTNDAVTSSGAHGDLVSYQGDTVPDGQWFDAWLAATPFGIPPGSVGVGDDDFVGVESIRAPKTARSPIITGTDGPNVIIGGDRGDLLKGEGGNDLIYGLAGNDVLIGHAGDDYLDAAGPTGPNDADRVDGGDGDDTCTGADSPVYQLDCETLF